MFLRNEIYSRIKLASILIVIAYLVITSSKKVRKVKVPHGPGMSHDDSTNCSEFAKYGRFNPYSVIHEKWFVFYYWAPVRKMTTYVFTAPSSNHTRKLKKLFEGNCVLPVQWNVRQLLMEDSDHFISLLVERSDRGVYWQYPVARVRKGQKITPRDIRLKQTGDNRLLGIFDCVDDTLIVMSRLNDVPPKGRLHEEASRLGYRGTKGKSYLYQGHEWGPIEEADEDLFWDRRKEITVSKDISTEDKSLEGSIKEAEQPTNEPQHLIAKKPKPKKCTAPRPGIPEDDETCVAVMPELWNDPEPNPNPDNLLTKEDLDHVNSLIINDNLAIEGPDASTDSKQEGNVDKESENFPENDKLYNDKDVYKMKTPDLTDNKQESNIDKESENPPENRKLHNHEDVYKTEIPESADNKQESNTDKESENPPENRELHNHKDVHKMETPKQTDNKQESNPAMESKHPSEIQKLHNQKDVVHKMEIPDSTDNKQESNTDKESENALAKYNPHNHKVCRGTTELEENVENCVVCFKSQPSYQLYESYVPGSARSMRDLKDNEDAPPKEAPHVDVPRFKIGGIELLLEEQPPTEVPIPKVPSAKTPSAEVPTPKVPSSKSLHTEVPIPKVPAKTPTAEVPTLKVPSPKTPHTEVPTPKVLSSKSSHTEVPILKVTAKTPSAEVPTPNVPSPKTPHIEVPKRKVSFEKSSHTEVPIPKVPAKTPTAEVPTLKVPSPKTPHTEVPTPKVLSSKSSHTEVPILKVTAKIPSAEVPTPNVPSPKTPHIEVPTPKVPSAKSPHTEVPIPKVPAKTTSAEVPTPNLPSSKTPHTEVLTPKVPSAKSPRTKVPSLKVPSTKTLRAKVSGARSLPPQDQTNSSEIIYLTPRTLDDLKT